MDILSYRMGQSSAGGGGGEAVLVNKDISANGTYNASADSADGYKKVVVDVPNSYAAGDEGKVVSNGALVAQGSETVTENGTYDTTLIGEMVVNSSGEYPTIYYNGNTLYLADTRLPADVTIPQNKRTTFFNESTNLVNFEWDTTDNIGGSGVLTVVTFFKNCTALEHVSFPNTPGIPTTGFCEDIILGCDKIKTFTVGSVGHPNTAGMGSQSGGYLMFRNITAVFDIVIYANADSLATVPSVLKTGSPWGAVNANIIYRSSVTGEVLT